MKHDPAPYYTGIRTDCQLWDVPSGTTSSGNLLNDLNNDTLSAFAFVTPNLCNDTHDGSVATGEAWLQSWLPTIFASRGYQAGQTTLFLVWDENDGSSGNQVPAIVVSPPTVPGTVSSTSFTHYSLLRTTEQMLGISTYLAHAGDSERQAWPRRSTSCPELPIAPVWDLLWPRSVSLPHVCEMFTPRGLQSRQTEGDDG